MIQSDSQSSDLGIPYFQWQPLLIQIYLINRLAVHLPISPPQCLTLTNDELYSYVLNVIFNIVLDYIILFSFQKFKIKLRIKCQT